MVSQRPILSLGLVRVKRIAFVGTGLISVDMEKVCLLWARVCKMQDRGDLSSVSLRVEAYFEQSRCTLDVLDHLAIAGRRRVALQLS